MRDKEMSLGEMRASAKGMLVRVLLMRGVLLMAVLASIVLMGEAQAETGSVAEEERIVVTNYADLKAALNSSAGKKAYIEISGAQDKLELGSLVISKGQAVDIRGKGKSQVVKLGGKNISNRGQLSLESMLFEGNERKESKKGVSGGVIENYGSIEALKDIKISGSYISSERVSTSSYTAMGGGIYNGGKIERIEESIISGNLVKGKGLSGGGGIYNVGELGEIREIAVKSNVVKSETSRSYGGGIYNGVGRKIKEISGEISENKAISETDVAAGGGLLNDYGGEISQIRATIIENEVKGEKANGGGISTTLNGKSKRGSKIGMVVGDFIKNYAEGKKQASGGGLFHNGYGEIAEGIRGNFTENSVKATGEAGEARGGGVLNYGYIKEIIGDFTKNYATSLGSGAYGGALMNIYNDGRQGIGKLSGKYESNYAEATRGLAQGGAIYNGAGAELKIKDSKFEGNYVIGQGEETGGGAIWNRGKIELSGSNEFGGNYVEIKGERVANDIYNEGVIELAADSKTVVKGGISGNGGEIRVGKGSELNIGNTQVEGNKLILADGARLGLNIIRWGTENAAQIGGIYAGKIELNGANYLEIKGAVDADGAGGEGSYKFAEAIDGSNGSLSISYKENEDVLYKYELKQKKDTVRMKYELKSAEELSQSLGISEEAGKQLRAVLYGKDNNERYERIRKALKWKAQQMEGGRIAELEELKDEAEQQLKAMRELGEDVFAAIRERQSERKNSTKQVGKFAVWTRGMNLNENGGELELSGVNVGADAALSEMMLVGAGYARYEGEQQESRRQTEMSMDVVYGYGLYEVRDWYVSLSGQYGWGEGEQKKTVGAEKLRGTYNIEEQGLEVQTGYRFGVGKDEELELVPQTGVRYYGLKREGYQDDAAIKYGTTEQEIVSGTLGFEAALNKELGGLEVKPRAYARAVYDVVNDITDTEVSLPNGNGYKQKNDSGARLGVESGLGMGLTVTKNVAVMLGWEYAKHGDLEANIYSARLTASF